MIRPTRQRSTLRPAALAVLCVAASLVATVAAAQPKAVINNPVHDVGTVDRGAEIVQAFFYHNTGDAPLEISEVKAACGCTVTEYPRTLAPGESSRILVTVDTTDFRGPIAKSATVYTNDPQNARINLVVKAVVRPQVEVQPGYARFLVVQGDDYEGSEQRLWSSVKEDLEVTKVDSPFPFVDVGFRRAGDAEDDAGNEWRIAIELDRDAPVGPLMDFVVVHTNHPDQPRVRIPLSGFVRPPVAATPQRLDLGDRALDREYPAKIELKVLGEDPVEMGEVTVDLDGVEAEVEEVEAGRLYNVVLTLGRSMRRGKVEGTVSVETSSPLQPRVEIPVVGTIL